MWSVLNCLDILSEDKDAATSSTADSLLKNIFCFNFVLGIMVPNSVLISIVYLHLLSTAVPAAAAHLPRAQPEVGAGRGGDQPVRGGDTLGCRVSATMVAVWMLCEKYRFDLANLASVPTSLVTGTGSHCSWPASSSTGVLKSQWLMFCCCPLPSSDTGTENMSPLLHPGQYLRLSVYLVTLSQCRVSGLANSCHTISRDPGSWPQ